MLYNEMGNKTGICIVEVVVSPCFCFSHPIIHNHGQNQRRVYYSLIENYYCQRLTELVDLKMYDEAHAIFEEFSLGDDESYQWFFIKILEDTTNE